MLKNKNSMYTVIDFNKKISSMGISSFIMLFIGSSPPEVFLQKSVLKNMQQTYSKTPMPKCQICCIF